MATNPSPGMIVDTVTEEDRVLGRILRRDAFKEKKNFRVVHVFIFNDTGEVLIQQISKNGTRHPLFWGSSVAGYLFSGETYEDAAKRRLEQELGVRGALLEFVGKTKMRDLESSKWIAVFRTRYSGTLAIDRSHIETVEFLSIRKIADFLESGSRQFTPTFHHLWNFYLGHELSA